MIELLAIAKIAPIVLSTIEMVKRFIPDKHRVVANPVLALVTGCISAYYVGGTTAVIDILMLGFGAGATAIGAYKIPKTLGQKLGIE